MEQILDIYDLGEDSSSDNSPTGTKEIKMNDFTKKLLVTAACSAVAAITHRVMNRSMDAIGFYANAPRKNKADAK